MTKGHYLFTILISSLFITLSSLNNGLTKATYSRSAGFSAVQLSYADLTSLINKTQSIVKSANLSSEIKWESSKIKIENGDSNKFAYEGEITEKAFINAPKMGSIINYRYQNSGGPISHYEIDFSDYRRTIEVEGESQEQVDVLFAMAFKDINSVTIYFGGVKQRIFLGTIISFIGLILIIQVASPKISRLFAVVFNLCGFLLLIFGVIFPWIDLFPGAVIYSIDTSFMAQHGGAITILGIILTLVTCIITLIYSRHLALSSKAPPSEPPKQI